VSNVLILGGDGYLGWPTAMHFSSLGHNVTVVDNYFRRDSCRSLDVGMLYPIPTLVERARIWFETTGRQINVVIRDLAEPENMRSLFNGDVQYDYPAGAEYQGMPETVIHYAEQPSAPYSLMSHAHADVTITNNLRVTNNLMWAVRDFDRNIHIIKLGTMGEYGTPNIDIEEGWLEVEHKGRSDKLLKTLLNYDEVFGTIVNRFVVQAIAGYPLTVYGKGGQTRGYLHIKDTLQCIEKSYESPASKGELRIFNQIMETFSANQLAELTQSVASKRGYTVEINHIENPRKEMEDHYYNPTYQGLIDIGVEPHYLTEETLGAIFDTVESHKNNIRTDIIFKGVKWG